MAEPQVTEVAVAEPMIERRATVFIVEERRRICVVGGEGGERREEHGVCEHAEWCAAQRLSAVSHDHPVRERGDWAARAVGNSH